jgi:hypothetical protein
VAVRALQVWAGLLLLLWSGATPYPTFQGQFAGAASVGLLLALRPTCRSGGAERSLTWWIGIMAASALGAAVQAYLQGTEEPPPGPSAFDNWIAMLQATVGHGLVRGGVLFGGGVVLISTAFRRRAQPTQPVGAAASEFDPPRARVPWRSPELRAVGLVGLILLSFEPACSVHDWKVDAYRAALHADLRSLAAAQAAHRKSHGIFTADLSALRYTPSVGVTVFLEEATQEMWRAVGTHVGLVTTCTAVGVAESKESRLECRSSRRWF